MRARLCLKPRPAPSHQPGSDPAELMPQELNPNINAAAPATAKTTTETTTTLEQ